MSRTMGDTLRAVAELLDWHPTIPTPGVTLYAHRPETAELWWHLQIDTPDEQKPVAAMVIRALGGHWQKDFEWGDTDRADFYQSREDGIELRIVVQRSKVCERVVTGTETVTIAAVEAQPERTEEREIVEWRCDEPILKAVG